MHHRTCALAKYIQWNRPQTYGEDKCVNVAMLGGLKIKKAMWKTYRDFLEVLGWTTALIYLQEGIISFGTACRLSFNFLKAAHYARIKHAHQVSALALT